MPDNISGSVARDSALQGGEMPCQRTVWGENTKQTPTYSEYLVNREIPDESAKLRHNRGCDDPFEPSGGRLFD
jgi:hypothetical protein